MRRATSIAGRHTTLAELSGRDGRSRWRVERVGGRLVARCCIRDTLEADPGLRERRTYAQLTHAYRPIWCRSSRCNGPGRNGFDDQPSTGRPAGGFAARCCSAMRPSTSNKQRSANPRCSTTPGPSEPAGRSTDRSMTSPCQVIDTVRSRSITSAATAADRTVRVRQLHVRYEPSSRSRWCASAPTLTRLKHRTTSRPHQRARRDTVIVHLGQESQQVAVQRRYVHGEQLLSHVRPVEAGHLSSPTAGSADVKRRPAIASHAAYSTRIAHHRRQQHLHGVVLRQINVPSAQRLHPGHTIEFDQTINVDEVEKYFVAQRPLFINRADELRRRPTQPPTETLPVPLRRRIRTTTQQQNQLTVPKFAIKKTDGDCRRCCLGMPVLDRVAGARSQSLIFVATRHQMSEHNLSPVAPMQL